MATLSPDSIENAVNKVIIEVTKEYKAQAEEAILPFVSYYLDKFHTAEYQSVLYENIRQHIVPQVIDDKVILKPRISVRLTSDTDPAELANSMVWTSDEYYKLAMFRLDTKVKEMSNNVFCIEENKEDRFIAVNCASVRGDIKFFV